MDRYRGLRSEDQDQGVVTSNKYDFVSQLAPGVWKVYRKQDKVEFIARDATDELHLPNGQKSPIVFLLDPKMYNIGAPIMTILNHENLVNFVDWIQTYISCPARVGVRMQQKPPSHFLVWDFCDAGTLENLFLPRYRPELTDDEKEERELQIEEAKAEGREYEGPKEKNVFLPESLCWHVVCSILKALMWLHHGIRDQYNADTGMSEQHRADVDWQTILHRDIMPSNIFFCHPRATETYGMCKLGNFGKAFVSGHVNGVSDNRVPASAGMVRAGRDGHAPLDQLRCLDNGIPRYQPPTRHRPYTISSEYRALADVMLAMMQQPVRSADEHVAWVRDRDFLKQLRDTDYSNQLKDMVYDLMSFDDGQPMPTARLYEKARHQFAGFRKHDKEGQAMAMIESVLSAQSFQEARKKEHNLMLNSLTGRVLEKQDAKVDESPNEERKGILDEIAAFVDRFEKQYEEVSE
ncbi:uncharacterized protein BCR38DRAFT_411198 [Pseudomassariella vexata]|uniref:Protein kinase domain-containing protein n=1 Tax=Pseudomassariella vexata TaxID=1141098 RepID=A0A1Y2DQA1_9PEZI|nr:uncharacterized protein BCR38DRAFT_411198 [Pseudomassariella vexata]ORY61314.1 hypothetical protein BCR38DRAFT_411198 [Pseudomassariella vexata]